MNTPSSPHLTDSTDQFDELCERLALASTLLAGDIAAIAPALRASFAAHLPRMEPPEDDVLRMLLFEQHTTEHVAALLQLPETDVLGWAAFGVVRLLADMPVRDMQALRYDPSWES
jgi:hypothetical protein